MNLALVCRYRHQKRIQKSSVGMGRSKKMNYLGTFFIIEIKGESLSHKTSTIAICEYQSLEDFGVWKIFPMNCNK